MTPLGWWVTCAFRDDQAAFYVKAHLEAERMHRDEKRPTAYVLPIDRADYWRKPKDAAYHSGARMPSPWAFTIGDDEAE